jgi:alpha-glucosidase (family GH31 glycosyl hydrolase)
MVGDSLLVAPVVTPGTTSVNVYFPGDQSWYDLENLRVSTCRGESYFII